MEGGSVRSARARTPFVACESGRPPRSCRGRQEDRLQCNSPRNG